jgi:type 1 glutamine amidotransferase
LSIKQTKQDYFCLLCNEFKIEDMFTLFLLFTASLVLQSESTNQEVLKKAPFKILVFSKTVTFRHESISSGLAAIQKLGKENGFAVESTEDATVFNKEKLMDFKAIVFLNTTGNILTDEQQLAFELYIRSGGGFVGIHAATDTEYDWKWYGKLVGAYFNGHPNNPNVRNATVRVLDKKHKSTRHLPSDWMRADEWYNFKEINPDIKVLCNLDETTYQGGTNGANHPIVWYHKFDGGRSFYTGFGHTHETFSEPLFLKHLLGGILYASGK